MQYFVICQCVENDVMNGKARKVFIAPVPDQTKAENLVHKLFKQVYGAGQTVVEEKGKRYVKMGSAKYITILKTEVIKGEGFFSSNDIKIFRRG